MNKVAWVLVIMGGLLIGAGVWMLGTAYASTSWPVVQGRIVESKVATRFSHSSELSKRRLEYYIEITYAYTVDGQEYQASRFSLGTGHTVEGGFNERSEAREWLRASPYQLNQPIAVYVAPQDPTNTVISAGIRFSTWIPIIVGLVFIFCGLMIKALVNHLKQTAKRPPVKA